MERGGGFAVALRRAIRTSGLTLGTVQDRLSGQGVRITVASLSAWQRGRSQPERPESLRAVTVLEELLDLAPRTLTGLIGPRRPRGRWTKETGRSATPVPREAATERMLDEMGSPGTVPIRGLYYEDNLVCGPDRRMVSVRTRLVGAAVAEGVNRYFAFNYLDPGQDLSAIEPAAVENCAVGLVRRSPDSHLIGTELMLDRTYQAGETLLLEYGFALDQPAEPPEYFRAFRSPIDVYLLRIRFDGGEVPRRCYGFRLTGRGVTIVDGDIPVRPSRIVEMAWPQVSPGALGIRWEWR